MIGFSDTAFNTPRNSIESTVSLRSFSSSRQSSHSHEVRKYASYTIFTPYKLFYKFIINYTLNHQLQIPSLTNGSYIVSTPISNNEDSFEISEVPNVRYCRGVFTTPTTSDLLILSQKNYRMLLDCGDYTDKYCQLLANIKNGSDGTICLKGLMGFFLPRKIISKTSGNDTLIKPVSIYYSVDDGKNRFTIQSYECALKKNILTENESPCDDCKGNWRSFRNNTATKYLKTSDHKKIVRESEKKFKSLNEEFQMHITNTKIKWAVAHKKMNKLFKRVAYWRKKFITLQDAVIQWRKVEDERDGFVKIDEDYATIWNNFYEFIDKQIDKQHHTNEEMRDLHKELIRSETSSLGKFNKRNDKRGVRTAKISSRILNYSITLANALGKVRYESEAQLRSLPTWDTISK